MDITPTQYHNVTISLYCYVTTPTSSTFSIYLGSICIQSIILFKFNHLKDIAPVYHHNLARSLSSTFSICLGSICIQSIIGDFMCDCSRLIIQRILALYRENSIIRNQGLPASSYVKSYTLAGRPQFPIIEFSLYIITTWREVYIVTLRRQHH